MKPERGIKILEELVDGAVCANECTGALQRISTDPEEVERLHDEYIGDVKRRNN